MAYAQVLQFSGIGVEKYDAVLNELGWASEQGKPQGLLAHAAGATADGMCVVEWWRSEGEWNDFLASRLQPAFEKVGGLPQPQMTSFQVHNSYPV